jgi:hypothetical protein
MTNPPEQVKTDNDFIIGMNATEMAPNLPVIIRTQQQAYRTAAWIKLMGEMLPNEDPASTYDEVETAIWRC